jgi:hypothetical protein
MNVHSQRHKPLRNLILIGVLTAVLVVVFWETTSLGGSREVGAEATAATDVLGKTNARAVTAYALYEIAARNDPSGSRALLLAREAVQYYLDRAAPGCGGCTALAHDPSPSLPSRLGHPGRL